MRKAAKIDTNQPEIVAALRAVGALVHPTHTAGAGFPDLVVKFREVIYLLEVKDGSLSPSRRKLTPDQEVWHGVWRGPCVAVVNSVDEALAVIGVTVKEND